MRDKIPEIIREQGQHPTVRQLAAEEFESALAQKLHEELEEFLQEPSPEEAADLLEVLRALVAANRIEWDEIERQRQAKALSKGGFNHRWFLSTVEDN